MKLKYKPILVLFLLCCLSSCIHFQIEQEQPGEETKLETTYTDIEPVSHDGDIQAVIEIPAGTIEKWELDKSTGLIVRDSIDGRPRSVDYLGYPTNYGLIPNTLLSKENGGDGDPLDVIVLGPPVERGSVVKCCLIGVLYLLDRGEQDDKLIAISTESHMYGVKDLMELNNEYHGVSEILQLWFTNYKGPDKMELKGMGGKKEAKLILEQAVQEYQSSH